ncbi:MAG: right-handed parallel beta-helix repeat-containing protein, partial [Candidatus Gracilibacteria bacterium]
MPNKPESAKLTIHEERRLNAERMAVDLGVVIRDASGNPVADYPFSVMAGEEAIMRAITDTEGSFHAKHALKLREGERIELFLLLEGVSVTDYAEIPTPPKPEPESKLESEPEVEKVLSGEEFKAVLAGKREVKEGEILKIEKGRHYIKGDILVEADGKLVIEAGAILNFDREAGIVCSGVVDIRGTKDEPITFKAHADSWRNFTLLGESVVGNISYCVIENGRGRMFKKDPDDLLHGTREERDFIGHGGGLYFYYTKDAEILLSKLTIRKNRSLYGGGVCLDNSHPEMKDIVITHNIGSSNGGGMALSQSSPNMVRGVIKRNKTNSNGGGMSLSESNPKITNFEITENEADGVGGGMHLSRSSPQMEGIEITKNNAHSRNGGGGGMSLGYSDPKMKGVK